MSQSRRHRLPVALLMAILAIFSLSAVAFATNTTLSGEVKIETRHSKKVKWSIDKSVSPSEHNLTTGESAKSTYTVEVDRVRVNRHGKVFGQICVTNTGTKFATKNLSVKARLRLGNPLTTVATKTLDVSSNPVLDPGETACYPFEFKLTASQFTTGTPVRVIGIVRITNYVGHAGSPYGINPQANTVMPAPTVYNGTVTIDDSWKGELGVVTNDKTFVYNRTFTCDGDEGTHPNTATIEETGQNDSASVKVNCEPPPDNGCTLTIGYWKNHDGSGPQDDEVTQYLPIWLGTANGAKSVKVEDTTDSHKILEQDWYSGGSDNGLNKLLAQLLAAKLNIANGASAEAVDDVISDADAFLATHDDWDDLTSEQQNQVLSWHGALDAYNNGDTGPGHCVG
jgi:hypothetical protein